MSEKKPVIEFKDVTFWHGGGNEKPAIKNINLKIYEGDYVALLGLNGAGKTTLQLCINGVIPNSIMGDFEGEVIVYGKDTYDTPVREMAKMVGMVFDNPEFQLSQMSVAEEIALGMESLGFSYDEMVETITEVLDIVGLQGLEERSPFGLSGGQQQRLSIAAALAMEPKILVMDEPTSNVDPIGKEEIFSVAAQLNREKNMTVIMAEHEVEVMAAYANIVIVMHEGEILLNGTPEEVFSNVELIQKLGLRLPQVTEYAHRLNQLNLASIKKPYPVTLNSAIERYKDIL
ncbi:MAG: ATP-binding cassette domain-containing protein [Chloroflexi bacterium]|jgi:energy-coupling factor transport system ATP-binding protein|nr:ATP-binding cassette domain-containing protein [Chloroflexota bacterium]MBT3669023.1 ATP-binding cassette domain-containing protein [Chloroflexota bacterium]MBT4003624.1 ATP-binding cassette domain-containing protein [Chloroflexota bacterium]MBT4304994.1 ATP-binding cassette domain-containing protein [Chloroflexota bacterium]MBT4533243.1 ATP-binding cassette domain-containing protein [Chloroflexota bacterium]